MSVIQIIRWKGGKREDVQRIFKAAGAVYKKHGAESVSAMQMYSGEACGEWIAFVHFKNFAAQEKVVAAVTKDSAFQKLLAELNTMSQFVGRDFAFDLPL